MRSNHVGELIRDLRRELASGGDEGSDAELLGRFLEQRDGEAFTILVRRHGAMVLGVCRRALRDCHAAEDAFQATFLVLARKARSVRQRASLASWLYGVAYRIAQHAQRDRLRRRAKERQAAELRGPGVTSPSLPSDLWELIDREVSLLPDRYRCAVILCDLEGLSRREAAHRLGWSEGTLSGRLFRARRLLANRLSRHGLSISGAASVASLTGVLAEVSAAPLSSPVLASTVEAALMGTASSLLAPSGAVILAEGIMKTMLLSKVKVLTACIAVTCLALGGGVAGYQALTAEPASAQGSELVVFNPEPVTSEDPPPPKPDPDPTAEEQRRLLDLAALREQMAEMAALARAREEQARLEAIQAQELSNRLRLENEQLRSDLATVLQDLKRQQDSATAQMTLRDRDVIRGERDQIAQQLAELTLRLQALDDLLAAEPAPTVGLAESTAPIEVQLHDPTQDRLSMQTYQVGTLVEQGAEAELIGLITKMIAPDSWSDNGGPGTIAYFARTQTLFVNQTAAIQDQVAVMINELTRLAEAHDQRLR